MKFCWKIMKNRLLATFINLRDDESEIEKVGKFLNIVSKKLDVDKSKFFIYKNLDDNKQFIITYNITITPENPVKFNEIYPNTIPINKSSTNTIYTINALNKLIELDSELGGNVDHKNYKIEWNNYENSLIMLKDDELIINKIKKINL